MATPVPLEEFDEVALRALLDESIVDALELGDGLALAVTSPSTPGEIARLAKAYLEARKVVRQCRQVMAVEAGRR